jgi:predicted nucleotidyltransferase component of viral defense system
MTISRETLLEVARETQFQPNVTEKVLHLLAFLNEMIQHPQLSGKFVLKGGTALNLFVFEAPRLSIDIDLNYVGAAQGEDLKHDREIIKKAVQAICKQLALNCQLGSDAHAGMKFTATYRSALGGNDQIQIDINFLYRVPLWPIRLLNSYPIGSFAAKNIPVLDECELFAGKLRALLARSRSRDLFDASNLFSAVSDPGKLRLALHIYGAMNAKDWRTVSSGDLTFNERELAEQLVPILKNAPSGRNLSSWATDLVASCQNGLRDYFPLKANEIDFIAHVRDKGQIVPSILTDDKNLAAVLLSHPSLLWRCSKAGRAAT